MPSAVPDDAMKRFCVPTSLPIEVNTGDDTLRLVRGLTPCRM
jgi:hypothetical protein